MKNCIAVNTLCLVVLTYASQSFAADNMIDATSLSGPAWSPYLVGAGIGILSWFTFYISDKPIGASSFYAMVAGFIGKAIAPKHTESLQYYKETPPKIGWEFVLILSTIVGAFIAAWTGGEFEDRWLNPLWVNHFGDELWIRVLVSLAGGILMAFGARLAGGCTSGHGISGTLQLNLASWISVICFFIGGILVAYPLYLGW